METKRGFATWGDAFNGDRGEMALQKAYARTTDFRELVYRLPGRPPFMLHRDVAAVYGVSTTRLMEQARRNMELENPKFLFQLTQEEADAVCAKDRPVGKNTPSQNASGPVNQYLPFGFTQLGANQIAFHLKSEVARQRSTQILEAFIHFEDLYKKGLLPGNGILGPGLLASGVFQRYGLSISDVAAICWFRDKNLTQVEVARICCITCEKVKQVEKTLRDAGIKLAPVIANQRARQMWHFFTRLVGLKGGVPLLKGGAI